MRVQNGLAATVAALLIGACGNLPELPVQFPESLGGGETRQAGELLAYYHRLTQMAPDEQRREYATIQAGHDKAPTDDTRIRLVLALLVPDAPWRDDAQALKLLAADPSLQQGKQSPRGDLAFLLDRLVSERMRLLREENRKLELTQQKMAALREEHRKMEALKQKLEAMNEDCSKAEALQKKLEGLREIDRDLRKRPARRSTP